MNERKFDEVFPKISTADPFSGRLKAFFGSCCPQVVSGSGVVISEKDVVFEGLTAKHVLLKGKRWFSKTPRPATSATFCLGENDRNYYGEIYITHIIPHPTFDICLFYGDYKGAGYDSRSLTDLIPRVSPTIVPDKRPFVINHYPDGVTEQRVNNGILEFQHGEIGYYKTCTFSGSSGAPLFSGTDIIGVHTSTLDEEDFAVYYKGRYFVSSRLNKCVLIDRAFIDRLRAEKPVYIR